MKYNNADYKIKHMYERYVIYRKCGHGFWLSLWSAIRYAEFWSNE